MKFSEKLDFLMRITGTSNSALAHSVTLDASYISRLRGGKRLIPKDPETLQSIASCLARRCAEEYQQKAVAEALKRARAPGDAAKFSGQIFHWLRREEEDASEKVGLFLGGMSGMADRAAPPGALEPDSLFFSHEDISIYYGVEGKRRAADYFLSEVASEEKPQTLLLYSDEETSWMTGDPAFMQRWSSLMARVLARGNRIKIIHTISRDLDEMLSAINQWMPLYMTGAIEPYFYPKKRDGIFRKTLFLAPETAAVVSGSIGGQIAEAANLLIRDRAAVASFVGEFTQYLRLCRPLMRIFTVRDREACLATLREFEQERADTLIKTESLSLLTMPEDLLSRIFERAGFDAPDLLEIHRARRRHFEEMTEQNLYTEIVALPDAQAVKEGKVKVAMSDMLGGGAMFYTPQEYARHLLHIIELLETRENFRVHLIGQPTEDRYMVYAREELGAIVAKTSQPPAVLAMNEGNMTAAFWDFLKNIIGEKGYEHQDKGAVVRALRDYLAKLCAKD